MWFKLFGQNPRLKRLLYRESMSVNTVFKVLSVLVFVLLSYLLLIELPPSPHPIVWLDKIQHLIAFGGFAGVTMLAFPKRIMLVAYSIAGYGAVMEFLQGWLTLTRQPGVMDWLADVVGILLAILVVNLWLGWWARRHARV